MPILSGLFVTLLVLGGCQMALAQQWRPFPINGGEGGQRPNAMAVNADGTWVLCGLDVGGVLQSLNGGKTWAHIGAGFDSYGSLSMATDPVNPDRAYIVGVSDSTSPMGSRDGVFRSTDRGATWTRVLEDLSNSDIRDRREQIAVDATSFDPALGYCTVVYYAQKRKSAHAESRILHSLDGGDTWSELSALQGVYNVAVCTRTGALLAGGADGLHRSTDRGETFTRVLGDRDITGLHAAGGVVAASTRGNPPVIYVSHDHGVTFSRVKADGIKPGDGYCFSLKISPADPRRMLAMVYRGGYDHARYVTHDGGETWQRTVDYDRSRSPVLICGQEKEDRWTDHAWHPTDPNIAWSTNHDYLVKSDDGGRRFFWSNAGYTGIYMGQGHSFHFNPYNPDYLALNSLDWNGAVTFDAGATWTEMRFRSNWWGWTYACMAVEPGVFFGGGADGHNAENMSLYVTYDNGKSYVEHKLDIAPWRPSYTAYLDPANRDVWFWLNYRSDDRGRSWTRMDDCAAVYTHDPRSKALYGIGGSGPVSTRVVRSQDSGRTWEPVLDLGAGEIRDIAIDHVRQIVLVATATEVLRHDLATGQTTPTGAMPLDQLGNPPQIFSVAVDPVDPRIIYVANGAHYYVPDTSAIRSTDGGETWHSIYPAERHGTMHLRASGHGTGAQDTLWVRVHPTERFALFGSNCKGFHAIGPPPGE